MRNRQSRKINFQKKFSWLPPISSLSPHPLLSGSGDRHCFDITRELFWNICIWLLSVYFLLLSADWWNIYLYSYLYVVFSLIISSLVHLSIYSQIPNPCCHLRRPISPHFVTVFAKMGGGIWRQRQKSKILRNRSRSFNLSPPCFASESRFFLSPLLETSIVGRG